jgi:hypothetical protein
MLEENCNSGALPSSLPSFRCRSRSMSLTA